MTIFCYRARQLHRHLLDNARRQRTKSVTTAKGNFCCLAQTKLVAKSKEPCGYSSDLQIATTRPSGILTGTHAHVIIAKYVQCTTEKKQMP